VTKKVSNQISFLHVSNSIEFVITFKNVDSCDDTIYKYQNIPTIYLPITELLCHKSVVGSCNAEEVTVMFIRLQQS